MGPVFEIVVARTARCVTLTLRGQVEQGDAAAAVRLCLVLPASVRLLEINARDVCKISDNAYTVLLALVRTWRRVRHGDVSIHASERAVRALGEHGSGVGAGDASVSSVPGGAPPSPALTAMYL